MPTYPQYFPSIPVQDKIVILADTDNNGKADKHTVVDDTRPIAGIVIVSSGHIPEQGQSVLAISPRTAGSVR
jgi:hypothetical protein